MAGSQISTSVTIINSLLGFQAISLSNMDARTAPDIKAGSKAEIASAFFTFASDETPQATTWAAINKSNTAFLTLTPSGTAGSQTVIARWSADYPIWSDSKQGWYDATATSIIRYIAGCHKSTGGDYDAKFILSGHEADAKAIAKWSTSTTSCVITIMECVASIGAWDMVADANKTVNLPLRGNSTFLSVDAVILTNAGTLPVPFFYRDPDAYWDVGASGNEAIRLYRTAAGVFDSVTYNATNQNRGFVYITYALERWDNNLA